MKNKPQKYGVRIECVADATSGVVVHMEIYSGQAGGLDKTVKALVIRLLEDLGGKNHRVYMDRRYSSPELFQALLDRGFYPVGTVMKSRKHLPKAFDEAGRLAAGEKVTRRKGQLLALRWKDKRDVYMLSTTVPDTMENTGRPATEAGGHQQQKPAAVLDYNSNKAGVDRHDQMSSYYPLARKTVKWWKKLFFQLLTMALVNAHKYYDIHNESKSGLECFIRQLAKDLSCVDLDDPLLTLQHRLKLGVSGRVLTSPHVSLLHQRNRTQLDGVFFARKLLTQLPRSLDVASHPGNVVLAVLHSVSPAFGHTTAQILDSTRLSTRHRQPLTLYSHC